MNVPVDHVLMMESVLMERMVTPVIVYLGGKAHIVTQVGEELDYCIIPFMNHVVYIPYVIQHFKKDQLGQKFIINCFLNGCSFSSILVQIILKSVIGFSSYSNFIDDVVT